jgi:hypothetical protein
LEKARILYFKSSSILLLLLSLIVSLVYEVTLIKDANAPGTWYGQDTLRVPIAWCAVRGSPAVENPNIPNPWGGSDRTTDEVLWRRHERVTDNIYINPSGISFRSAINDALHTSLDFPTIDDPNLSPGVQGNVSLQINLGEEYVRMLHDCESAWVNLSIGGSGVVNGIITVNVRRFVNPLGVETDTTGTGKCTLSSGICAFPYDGHLAVIDNYFMFPGISSGFANNDPFDQALGHELGHALSLPHRNWDINALMNTNQQHNGPGGTVSNIVIYSDEVIKLRDSALRVPGMEIDPDNKVIKGDIVQSIEMDNIQENKTLDPSEDISSVKVSFDKKQNLIAFTQKLFGFIPERTQPDKQYWTLVDLDNDTNTGANQTLLQEIGVPLNSFAGTDLVILAEPSTNNVTGSMWTMKNETISPLSPGMVRFDIQNVSVHLDTAGIQPVTQIQEIPLYSTINAIVDNTDNFVGLDKPLSLQAIVYSNGSVVDRLDDGIGQERKTLVLKQPLFPQCFVNENATQGKNATVDVSGLTPNSSIHALLGPRLVANGTTDNSGNSTVGLPIPIDATPGLHLVTIGKDNSALTADCEINVQSNQTM